MKRIFFILLFFSLGCLATAQTEKYTVAGKISFQAQGDIYIYLVTKDVFKTPFTGVQTLKVHIGPAEAAQKEIPFAFHNVKSGRYGIRCFQDENDNGKLDRGLGGPAEPWGMSWQTEKPRKWPRFCDISFDVEQNIFDIYIEVKK
jgi:uncharacterized protein (DUF2141 family)